MDLPEMELREAAAVAWLRARRELPNLNLDNRPRLEARLRCAFLAGWAKGFTAALDWDDAAPECRGK